MIVFILVTDMELLREMNRAFEQGGPTQVLIAQDWVWRISMN